MDADPTRISQVNGNLLGNAIKYSPEESTITLKARREEAAAIVTIRDRRRNFGGHA